MTKLADGSSKFTVKVGKHPWTQVESKRAAQKLRHELKQLDAGVPT